MIRARRLRDLDLRASSEPRGRKWLSAASGLVRIGENLFVVADDELHLGVFPASSRGPGTLVRLLPGRLPRSPADRKRRKPDLEALAFFPEIGLLLACPSGSAPNRKVGVALRVESSGKPCGSARPVDFGPLFAGLRKEIPALNIEGCLPMGKFVLLLQRGNAAGAGNALVELDRTAFASGLSAGLLSAALIRRIQKVDLGRLGGTRLSFTDAAAVDDELAVFSAAAEETPSAYLDGPVSGSALGLLDRKGRVSRIARLAPKMKAEGILVRAERGGLRVLLVTDADDPAHPAGLYAAKMEL